MAKIPKVRTLRMAAPKLQPREADGKATVALTPFIPGNDLFNRAVFAIGLDGQTTRHLLDETLRAAGTTPHEVTLEALVAALPAIDERLARLVPDAVHAAASARLQKLATTYEG